MVRGFSHSSNSSGDLEDMEGLNISKYLKGMYAENHQKNVMFP